MTDNPVAVVITLMLGITILTAGVWDIYAFLILTPKDTVSYVCWQLIQRFPPLILLLGMILGHVLWPLHVSEPPDNPPPKQSGHL